MVLILTADMLRRIRAHAEQAYPEECCGLLVGRSLEGWDGPPDRSVVEAIAVDNDWQAEVASELGFAPEAHGTLDPKQRRYWIDPKTLLTVQRTARDRGLDIIGVYHSHPDHPAVPSECDRALAWSGYSYIIVSVAQGQATDLRSWCLDEAHQFQVEALRMEAQPPNTLHPKTSRPLKR